jgi:hypothetical protein
MLVVLEVMFIEGITGLPTPILMPFERTVFDETQVAFEVNKHVIASLFDKFDFAVQLKLSFDVVYLLEVVFYLCTYISA